MNNEQEALKAFTVLTGKTVQETGIWLDLSGILVASPDGIVDHEAVLEAKCPYTYKDNILQVSCDKYQGMLLGCENTEGKINFKIDGQHIEQTHSIKILGVHIDDKLNFGPHPSEICKSVSKQVLKRLKNLIPTSAKLLFKCALTLHLTYCHLVWHFSRASDWRKLERLQEQALRAAFNNTSDTYETLLQKPTLITLYNRRLQDILMLVHKVKSGRTPRYLTDLFQLNCEQERKYNLRNSDFRWVHYRTVTHLERILF